MRFYVTRRDLIWLVLFLSAVIYALFLTGCGAGLRPPGAPRVHDGPAAALAGLAVWAAWAAGAGLLCCGVAAIWLPDKLGVAKIAVGFLTMLAVSFLLGWVAAHAALVMGGIVIVLLLGAVGYTWLHRADVKKKTGIDLNWLCRVRHT